MKVAMKTIEKLEKAGFKLIENDGIDDIENLSSDVSRALLSYEAPRSIEAYLHKHNSKKTFEFVTNKLQSDDTRRILKLLTRD